MDNTSAIILIGSILILVLFLWWYLKNEPIYTPSIPLGPIPGPPAAPHIRFDGGAAGYLFSWAVEYPWPPDFYTFVLRDPSNNIVAHADSTPNTFVQLPEPVSRGEYQIQVAAINSWGQGPYNSLTGIVPASSVCPCPSGGWGVKPWPGYTMQHSWGPYPSPLDCRMRLGDAAYL